MIPSINNKIRTVSINYQGDWHVINVQYIVTLETKVSEKQIIICLTNTKLYLTFWDSKRMNFSFNKLERFLLSKEDNLCISSENVLNFP